MTIDVALEAKRLGMFVVALTSRPHAAVSTSRHESGRKLHEVADLVLDQQAPAGDSAVWIDGLETPGGADLERHGLHDHQPGQGRGRPPPDRGGLPPKVLTAACHLGAERARDLFEATYDDYRRRVGVLYT